MSEKRSHRRILLANFVTGLLLPLSFAPFGHWWLAPLIVAGALTLWRDVPARLAFRYGFAFGAGLFLAGTYWLYISIHVFGRTPLWIAVVLMIGLVLIMALYYGAIAMVVARLGQRRGVAGVLVGVPAAWMLADWLRGWILSGFPWLALGYSQLDSPLAGFAPVLGVYGVGFAVAGIASALTDMPGSPPRRIAVNAVYIMALAAIGYLLNKPVYVEPSADTLRVAIVQGGIDQDDKWLPENREPTMALYRDQTLASDATLVVWPEVAIPATRLAVEPYLAELDAELAGAGRSLALGILTRAASGDALHNSIIAIGTGAGSYHKQHLVPFGEYFPVPDFVREWMRLMSLPSADLEAGGSDQAALRLAGHAAAATICYEDAYPWEQRHFFPAARFIVNVSNDAWFGDSIAPHHHLDIARMRSMESRRWQVRATNTGVSALISPTGKLVDQAPQFELATIEGTIRLVDGSTPYLELGNTPLMVTGAFSLLLLLRPWRREYPVASDNEPA